MTLLILGLFAFLGIHSLRIVAEPWRNAQIARLGVLAWKGLYALISIASFAVLVWGFKIARAQPVVLYVPPPGLRHLAGLLTILAFILVAAAYVPATRIKAKIGHPMVAGVKAWAVAHLLANGTLADVVLFGSFLLWAIFDFAAARRRDRAAGRVYVAGPISRDVIAIGIGAAAWVVFAFWLHGILFGVRPFG